MQDKSHTDTRVLYNAQCPVCSFEINHYDAYSKAQNLPILFDDLNADVLAEWDMDADTAAKRLHVLHNGQLIAGIPAFLVLWQEMPRYRLLGRIVGLPGIRHAAIAAYDYVLAPAIYAWHKRRQNRAVAKG